VLERLERKREEGVILAVTDRKMQEEQEPIAVVRESERMEQTRQEEEVRTAKERERQ
jgi:hypothetical protein